MAKEPLAVLGAEGEEAVGEGALEFIQGAGSGLAQVGVKFGERQFGRVKIRAVSRQVTHAGAVGRDQVGDAGGFVRGEVIEDDDVTLPQFRAEHLPEVSEEDLRVDRAFDQKRRVRLSARRAAMNVEVCQWPCGMAPTQRRPLGQRP